MNRELCTHQKNNPRNVQVNKSKIFQKFFAKFEKNLLLLHYSEDSNISLLRKEDLPPKTYIKIADKAQFWLTKVDCYLEAIPPLIKTASFFQALDLFEMIITEVRRNDYSLEKEICYLTIEKLKSTKKEVFASGFYEFLADVFKLEANALTKYEPEKATQLAELAQKCEFLENQRWKLIRMILVTIGDEGRYLMDCLRFTGDFNYVINNLKKFENHPKKDEIDSIVARASSLQTLKDEIAKYINA